MFVFLFCFLNIIVYIPNIASPIERCQSMKSEILSSKTIINALDFLKKTVIIQLNIIKKDLQLFSIKLTEKTPDSCNVKILSIIYKKEKHKTSKPIKITQQPKAL